MRSIQKLDSNAFSGVRSSVFPTTFEMGSCTIGITAQETVPLEEIIDLL
jgi:hypothetical protein